MRELENLGTITALRRRDLKGYMIGMSVCTENLIRVDDVMELPKLAE